MRAGVLNAGWFGFARPLQTGEQEHRPVVESIRPRAAVWNAARFASEQMRNLVRRVFDESATPPVRQVIFSAIDPDVEIQNLCESIGEALALEMTKDVAIVSCKARDPVPIAALGSLLRNTALQSQTNVWLLSSGDGTHQRSGSDSLHRYLQNVRREFEYSIVVARPGALNEVVAAARVADGTVLVVSAAKTRRASASRFVSALAHVRLLGTVLVDRDFPMPEAIYRRL